MTWTGAGQGQWVKRTWTDHTTSTSYSASFTYSLLGMSGRMDTSKTPTTSYFVRDPYGRLVSQRNTDGTENYYLFDGQGTVALEDPGSYDICPTGNEADVPTTLTAVAKNNPYRQNSTPYDDDLQIYFPRNGQLNASYTSTGTEVQMVIGRSADAMPGCEAGGKCCADCVSGSYVEGPPASTPVGRVGSRLKVQPGTNAFTTLNGISYSGHVSDRMQERGIPPSDVEEALTTGIVSSSVPGTSRFHDPENNIKVFQNDVTGVVITVFGGRK